MDLQHIADYDRIVERFEAWWHCQIVDRPPVTVQVRPHTQPTPIEPTGSRRNWALDAELVVNRFEANLAHQRFVGDTLPIFNPNVGPDQCATLFGAELEFGEKSTWCHPILSDVRQVIGRQPAFDNDYWRAITAMTRLSVHRGTGRWITGMPDLHTNADTLSALRGPENLCLDCVEDLEGVAAACQWVTRFFPQMFDNCWSIVSAAGQPCTSWIPCLHRGRSYNVQSDFICMISPAMFRHAVLPSLRAEMAHLERSIYHLDGPAALVHLDDFLSLPELNGLEWMFGAGQGPSRKWLQIYQRIQAAGKCIELCCENFEDAQALAEHLRPEGIWFRIWGAYPEEDARAFVAWVGQWAAAKHTQS